MAKQPFDFNRLMLEKGEKLGLTVCGLFMLIMAGFGVSWILSSNPPTATARELDQLTDRIQAAIRNNKPPEGTDKVSDELMASTELKPVGFGEFVAIRDFFTSQSFEDSKRQRVDVVAPATPPTAQVLLAPVRSLILSSNKGEMMYGAIVSDATAGQPKNAANRPNSRLNQLTRLAGPPGMAPGGPGPGGAAGMPPAMGPQALPASVTRKRPIRAGDGPFSSPPQGKKFQMMKWDDKAGGAKFAETTAPHRMVIVSFEFPYREQLKNMQYALRHQSMAAMFNDPNSPVEFNGFNVERQVIATPAGPNAKPRWEPLDLEKEYKPILLSAVEYEREDEELEPVLVAGLTTPRPVLRDMKYPRCRLPGILKALDEWREIGKQAQSAVESQNNKFSARAPSLFNERPKEATPTPGAPMAPGGARPTRPGAAGVPGQPGVPGVEQDLWVPEFCLLRFIDADVKPGYTYQYRVQVKMLNPNYKKKDLVAFESLAEKEQMVSDWSKTVATAAVPEERHYYFIDQEKIDKAGGIKAGEEGSIPNPDMNRDRVFLQVHRWLDEQRLSPTQETNFPIGNWAVSENKSKRGGLVQQSAARGEYIGHYFYIELPVWDSLWESFYLPNTAARTNTSKGIPVNFTTPDILLDFDGGKGPYQLTTGKTVRSITDESPVEVLVMLPDGRLELHNSRDDAADETRQDRLKEWRAWVENTRTEMDRLANGGQPGAATPDQPLFRK